MNANEYQQLAMRTKADPVKILARLNELGPAYVQAWVASNGLTNEGGEVSDILKASIEYGKGPVDTVHLKEEIGDSLWRLSQLADAFGLTLEECMRANVDKLSKRYPDKFCEHLANNRDLTTERKALEGKPYVFKVEHIPQLSEAKKQEITQEFLKRRPNDGLVSYHDSTRNYSQNGHGFAEPPQESQPDYVKDGWTFGIPSTPGDYVWFHKGETPKEAVTYENFNGSAFSWGRDTWYKLLPKPEEAIKAVEERGLTVCPVCRGNKNLHCDACDGTGKVSTWS